MIAQSSNTTIASAALTQSGETTHHHDQVIIPASFAIVKIIVSHPASPMFFILALVLIYCFAVILTLLPQDENPAF
jgi:lysophospholipid acyltransferase (LPLAT)-like uncharacterized protein